MLIPGLELFARFRSIDPPPQQEHPFSIRVLIGIVINATQNSNDYHYRLLTIDYTSDSNIHSYYDDYILLNLNNNFRIISTDNTKGVEL